jgi:hypothetical protein
VGAQAELASELEPSKERHEAYTKAYQAFAEILGREHYRGKELSKERAVQTTIAELRKVLGIEELTKLRSELVERAGNRQNV